MGVVAPDVRTTFSSSFIAATAAMCRTGGRTRSMRHAGKRRRRERELKNGCGCQNVEEVVKEQPCRMNSSPAQKSLQCRKIAHFSLSTFTVSQRRILVGLSRPKPD